MKKRDLNHIHSVFLPHSFFVSLFLVQGAIYRHSSKAQLNKSKAQLNKTNRLEVPTTLTSFRWTSLSHRLIIMADNHVKGPYIPPTALVKSLGQLSHL